MHKKVTSEIANDSFGNPTNDQAGYNILMRMNQEHRSVATWAFKHFKIHKDDVCLDVGCGGGANIKRMVKKAKHVTGIDISAMAIKVSREVNQESELASKIDLQQVSIEEFAAPANTFSLITAFSTVYFWTDYLQGFKNIYRLLANKGCFCLIITPAKKQAKWKKIPYFQVRNEFRLLKDLQNIGFNDLQLITEPQQGFLLIKATKI
ncbi:methyltransferase domain-containing protein [Ureaplasma miroungigenitalium]|uniref:Methyltransferase domain-containing protein n=1 Tax=Ureaplasma miroungigenitalium TaxID=1042321 RepID=A0ABT3BMZ6_9BACT|nr:class I SAM-dependent methyltransferase [Ureaplasma miroungigenitalium]MCV3728596.1 methyltransferase domain-containing protein [Ureaplasma miroungigenitalium]MCV3734397.1 methyltransferase domain-containing protein [Ureaplasma miroungigenitalium]